MAFGNRKAKPVAVKVASFGEDIEVGLRPLSALEMDAIEREFPAPVPPKKDVDGRQVPDREDADYVRQRDEWSWKTRLLVLCRQIGNEHFTTGDISEQVKALQSDFTVKELAALIMASIKVQAGTDPNAHMEAAKSALTPTDAGTTDQAPESIPTN